MSYSPAFFVKVEGLKDTYAYVKEFELHVSYRYGRELRKALGWDYDQDDMINCKLLLDYAMRGMKKSTGYVYQICEELVREINFLDNELMSPTHAIGFDLDDSFLLHIFFRWG